MKNGSERSRSAAEAPRLRTSGLRSTSIQRNGTRFRSRKSRYSWTRGERRRPTRYTSPGTATGYRAESPVPMAETGGNASALRVTSRSPLRLDVLVDPEDVVGVVGGLDGRQPVVVLPVAGAHALLPLLHHHVHIRPTGRERM